MVTADVGAAPADDHTVADRWLSADDLPGLSRSRPWPLVATSGRAGYPSSRRSFRPPRSNLQLAGHLIDNLAVGVLELERLASHRPTVSPPTPNSCNRDDGHCKVDMTAWPRLIPSSRAASGSAMGGEACATRWPRPGGSAPWSRRRVCRPPPMSAGGRRSGRNGVGAPAARAG